MLPIALPQTELRSQTYLQIGTFTVVLGQRLEISCLFLHCFKILTPGVVPALADSTLGLCSVGMMASSMLTSAVGLVTIFQPGVAGWNEVQPVVITAPGVYQLMVYNNARNADLDVVVTGAARITI